MAAVKIVALLALLQLTAAWLLPPHTENFTFDSETANCSGATYEDWLEAQPQPVFVDVFSRESELEEAEEVEDYVEPVVEIDHDVDPMDSESTDQAGDDEDSGEEGDDGADLLDFIVNDDVPVNRFRRDVIGHDIEPTQGAAQAEDSDEHDAVKDSSEENGDQAKSSEEERNEENSSEEENEDPYAFLRVKVDRSSEGLLAPQERVKVMLKNFQKGRMTFLVTASAQQESDDETTGSFSSQPFLIKLRGCWLEHKHNAHNVCKHHHGRKHHGRGRHHHGRGRHHHGEHHRGEHHRGEHHQDLHPHAEANEVDNESGREQENNTAFDFKSHKFREPAEGDASLCSPSQLEGWLGPESKMVIAYSAPTRGCIVFRAYVGYPINNGTLVLTPDGNAEYLQSMICVQPNPIPEEDEYDEYDDENIDIIDYPDHDSVDTANVIDTINTVDSRALPDEEEEDDEEDSFTPRRGRAGYNLRPRPTINREPGSDEEVIDDDETDEDYVPDFLTQDRSRRSPDEMSARQLRRQERREMRHARKEERRLRREGRHNRRDAGDDPSSNVVEGAGGQGLTERQRRRQQKKEQRRLQRQERRQGRQGAGASEATSEGPGSEGRRGRGGRRNRPDRPDRPNRRNRQPAPNNRRLHSNLTDTGSKFCCKQGIQHKKASTYTNDDGTTPEVNCSVVPDEVPSWAAHKHPISKEVCEGHYTRCCNQFDLELWKAFQERREARRAQRENRQHG